MRRVLPFLMIALVACGGDDGGDGGGDGVPPGDYCAPAASFTTGDLEDEVLRLVNQHRAAGASCGGTAMPAVAALTMDPALRCAARVHTLDMHDRDYFDHTNPDGEQPWDRMEKAGYPWSSAGENIAAGNATAAATVAQWMGSTGHCRNIMSADYVHIGVGHVADGALWTQVFGAPR